MQMLNLAHIWGLKEAPTPNPKWALHSWLGANHNLPGGFRGGGGQVRPSEGPPPGAAVRLRLESALPWGAQVWPHQLPDLWACFL